MPRRYGPSKIPFRPPVVLPPHTPDDDDGYDEPRRVTHAQRNQWAGHAILAKKQWYCLWSEIEPRDRVDQRRQEHDHVQSHGGATAQGAEQTDKISLICRKPAQQEEHKNEVSPDEHRRQLAYHKPDVTRPFEKPVPRSWSMVHKIIGFS